MRLISMTVVACMLAAAPAAAQVLTAFEEDVNAAVEDGVQWAINNSRYTNGTLMGRSSCKS